MLASSWLLTIQPQNYVYTASLTFCLYFYISETYTFKYFWLEHPQIQIETVNWINSQNHKNHQIMLARRIKQSKCNANIFGNIMFAEVKSNLC